MKSYWSLAILMVVVCLAFCIHTATAAVINPTAATSAAIQTAINTATTQLTTGTGQGVVELTHPVYTISTPITISPGVTLRGVGVTRMNVNVDQTTMPKFVNAEPLTNGVFVFTVGLGSVFSNVNIFIDNAYNGTVIGVHGAAGYWNPHHQNTQINNIRMLHWGADPATPLAVGLGIISSPTGAAGSSVQYARFQNIHIDRFRIGVLLSAYKTAAVPSGSDWSWVNGNDFDSIFLGECVVFIQLKCDNTKTAETTGNAFRGLQIQPSTITRRVFDIQGHGNSFTSGTAWDLHMMAPNKAVRIDALSRGNHFDVGLEMADFTNLNTNGVSAKNRNEHLFTPYQP